MRLSISKTPPSRWQAKTRSSLASSSRSPTATARAPVVGSWYEGFAPEKPAPSWRKTRLDVDPPMSSEKQAKTRSSFRSPLMSAATTSDAPRVLNLTSGVSDHPSSEPQKRTLSTW